MEVLSIKGWLPIRISPEAIESQSHPSELQKPKLTAAFVWGKKMDIDRTATLFTIDGTAGDRRRLTWTVFSPSY